jgi:cellulose synthase/poly-beta-1,6-N-acetylglucosamine synthase-like glycosyltransferase
MTPLAEFPVLETLLWVCLALIAYTYLGYPVLISLLARCFSHHAVPSTESLPSISLIISAFNEESVMEEKLLNSLALDYPSALLEIIVVSDCSEDKTDDIAKSFSEAGVRLVRQGKRLGKSCGLNFGVPSSSGTILVFSDANAIYERDALRQLTKHFSDPAVGYVVGNARYRRHAGLTPSAESEGLYWRLESWLKQKESAFGSVVGGDGAIYAIRREMFTPLRPTDINDLLNPLQIIARGYRGIYEPAAVCYEDAGDSFQKEFRRKVRIISRSISAVFREYKVLFPWNQFRHWLCLISHKILRWLAPVLLIASLIFSLLLWHFWFYRMVALAQLGFYALGVAAWILGPLRSSSRIFYLTYYFCLMNLASLLAIVKFLTGSITPTWETIRGSESVTQERSASPVGRKL